MNLYEAKDFFEKTHQNKTILFEFDDNCHKQIDIGLLNGVPYLIHHLEFNKVKITIEKQDPIYFPIAPHRLNITWDAIKKMINAKMDVAFPESDIHHVKALKDNPNMKNEYEIAINERILASGLTKEQIEQKYI